MKNVALILGGANGIFWAGIAISGDYYYAAALWGASGLLCLFAMLAED